MSRLYPCVYYTEDGHCKKYSDDEVTSWCVQGPCEYETPSNADRIRRMSDEELARFLSATEFKRCDYRPVQEYDFAVWFEWLKKEAE